MAVVNVFHKAILVFCIISFISARRFDEVETLYWFDGGIVLYIMFSLFTISLKKRAEVFILRYTYNQIRFLFVVLAPSFLFLAWANDIKASVRFLSQYVFLIVTVPLFLDFVYRNGQLDFLLKGLYWGLIVLTVYFLLFFGGANEYIFLGSLISEDNLKLKFGDRFTVGDFTPNEMGHFFVLLIFLIRYYKGSIVGIITFPAFILTFSKTVWLQMLAYFFMSLKFNLWRLGGLLILISCIILSQPRIVDVAQSILFDFSLETKSNAIRVEMYSDSLINMPYSLMKPAYHSVDNLVDKELNVVSAHNGILSYITNFGIISFLILLIGMVLFVNKAKSSPIFNVIITFAILDLVVLMFNPLINARLLWFPLFLYMFLLDGTRTKNIL